MQDQAAQRYYRPNTRTTLLILITTAIKKHARTGPSFHASVLTVLCTYLRRADVYISGSGDLIVAPYVCTKAARSGKAWLTVLISDDRYGPGCNANEPHAIAPATTLEAWCMRDARFRRVRSPVESRYKAGGPHRARLPISRLSCNYHVTGSSVPRHRGNQSNKAPILRWDGRSLFQVIRARASWTRPRFITPLNKHYAVLTISLQ